MKRSPVALNKTDFFESLIPGSIFQFSCAELGTAVPHFFVCVCLTDDELLVMSCCTSQQRTMENLINRMGLAHETIVFLPNRSDTPFYSDTFVNCNEYFPYGLDEMEEMKDNSQIEYFGILPDDVFEQIINGFLRSKLIEDQVKERLPKLD
jgi:hypothetical protein